MQFKSCLVMVCLLTIMILTITVRSVSIKESLSGSPYLFHEFSYPVDPYRAARLAPAFQAANGKLGSRLVAYFGTGNLRSVERPVYRYQDSDEEY